MLYRASDNGYSAKCFHQLCDGKGPTVLIVKVCECAKCECVIS